MITRSATIEDFPKLAEIHEQSGLKFPMPPLVSPMIEAVELVVDERGEILMGAVAQRAAELYLLAPAGGLHPVVKMDGIRLLHGAIRDNICPKGYTEGFAFIPPGIERSYGRHLRKWFGWEATWKAYRIADWKSEAKDA
jgi:hypothetical protein